MNLAIKLIATAALAVGVTVAHAAPQNFSGGDVLSSNWYSSLHTMGNPWQTTQDISGGISFTFDDINNNGLDAGDTVTLSDVVLDLSSTCSGTGCYGDRLRLSGTLTVGGPLSVTPTAPSGGWPLLDGVQTAMPTNLLGGSLDYIIERDAGNPTTTRAFGETFDFDTATLSPSIFNSIYFDNGRLVVYLWGDGDQEHCIDGPGYDLAKCQQYQNYYLLNSRGIDLAFWGKPDTGPGVPPAGVPSPATGLLLVIGLVGMQRFRRTRG